MASPGKINIEVTAQADKMKAELARAKKSVKDFGGGLDDLIGGKFSLQKGAKYGVAGLVAGFVSDTMAGITDGLVKAKDQGGGWGNYSRALADTVPILGGIVKTVENIDELFTGVRATGAKFATVLEHQNAATKSYHENLKESAKIWRDTLKTVEDFNDARNAGRRGGIEGNIATIAAKKNIDVRGVASEATTKLDAMKEEFFKEYFEKRALQKKYTQDEQTATAQAKSLREEASTMPTKGAPGVARAAIEARAKALEEDAAESKELAVAMKNAIKVQSAGYKIKEATIKQGALKVSRAIMDAADEEIKIASRQAENTKVVEDRMLGMSDAIATMDVDPFKQMINEFKILQPTGVNLAKFTKQVEELKKKSKDIEAEGFLKNLKISGAGIGVEDPIAAQLAQLKAQGFSADWILQIRIELERQKAANDLLAFTQEMKGLNQELARLKMTDPFAANMKAIEDEINARKDLNDQQKREEIALRKKILLQQEANSLIESIKTPEQQAADQITQIQRQLKAGLITEAQAGAAIDKARGSYQGSQSVANAALMSSGSAAAQRAAYIAAGAVQDGQNPQLREQKRTNEILLEIKNNKNPQNIVDEGF